jgi:ATP-dependent DNA helicase PIF1
MLSMMGWDGSSGLGATGQGIVSPLTAQSLHGQTHREGIQSSLTLDATQASIISAVREGHNVFFTGVAGTGKSFVLDKVKESLRERFGIEYSKKVAITGPTGVSAILIGGQTLHSFAGCGVPGTVGDYKKCWNKLSKKKWRNLEVLLPTL